MREIDPVREQLQKDSQSGHNIQSAALAIEIARRLDLAKRRGECGVLEEVGVFFKFPMTRTKDAKPENALHKQETVLIEWLAK